MTIKRYRLPLVVGSDLFMIEDAAGRYVLFTDAQATIQKLGDELFSCRAQLHSTIKQRDRDITVLQERIDQLIEQKRQAIIALGFADPEES
jgi:hypothetical protein